MIGLKSRFITRLLLAWRAFLRTFSDPEFAALVDRRELPALPAEGKPALRETAPESALQLLGLLQQEGRFVDFLEENVSGYSDTEIGGAARVVHEGCRKALRAHLTLTPVRSEPEGSRLTIPVGFDPAMVRLTGHLVGNPPFSGTLMHRGWQVTEVKLPRLAEGHNMRILMPAEVEL
jgi:hypothetical protein